MMPQMKCPCCAQTDQFKTLIAMDGDRQICRCRNCRLVLVHPMPTGQEIADYYQGFTFGMPNAEQVSAHEKLITSNVARIVDDLREAGCLFDSALDFGGGLGFYANAFANYFNTVDMFDLDRVALDHARRLFPERFGLRTTEPGELPKFDRKYDLIFANQVIEHYTDLDLFFETLHAAAHEQSVIVITTPNNDSPNLWVRPEILAHYTSIGSQNSLDRVRTTLRLARDSWACCDPPRHVLAFNRDNLGLVAQRHALQPLRVTSMYCTDDYYSPAKYQAAKVESLRSALRRVFNAVVRRAIRLLRIFDRAGKRGDDLVLLAKVKERRL